jgi:hypothetical protein
VATDESLALRVKVNNHHKLARSHSNLAFG